MQTTIVREQPMFSLTEVEDINEIARLYGSTNIDRRKIGTRDRIKNLKAQNNRYLLMMEEKAAKYGLKLRVTASHSREKPNGEISTPGLLRTLWGIDGYTHKGTPILKTRQRIVSAEEILDLGFALLTGPLNSERDACKSEFSENLLCFLQKALENNVLNNERLEAIFASLDIEDFLWKVHKEKADRPRLSIKGIVIKRLARVYNNYEKPGHRKLTAAYKGYLRLGKSNKEED